MDAYHYTECGLKNVHIVGLQPFIDEDGDEVIEIPAVNQLHHLLAKLIVLDEKGMRGDELRFLRTKLGQTQEDLASLLHVDRQTIGRWERGEFPIDGCAETVIRRLTVEKLLIPFEETMERQAHDEQMLESSEQSARSIPLERLMRSRVATAEPKAIEIKIENGGYKLLAA